TPPVSGSPTRPAPAATTALWEFAVSSLAAWANFWDAAQSKSFMFGLDIPPLCGGVAIGAGVKLKHPSEQLFASKEGSIENGSGRSS
ncbi:hypothetical protein, partial [Phenylobacterium sp.]|uniref:hypothetical protein n=1 Tax=Phenylobacterium sp. TaxID=1871053 RepID=UPI0025FCD102